MAKIMFGVSISLVSLIDEERLWFISSEWLDACETSKNISFVVMRLIKMAFYYPRHHRR
jgi:hypothetical protein